MKQLITLIISVVTFSDISAQVSRLENRDIDSSLINSDTVQRLKFVNAAQYFKHLNLFEPFVDYNLNQGQPIDLKFNYYYKSYPVREYYVNGRNFMTIQGPFYPPYPINSQYIDILKEKNNQD